MDTPIISVILPIYNVAPYLRACLNSILAQTFTDFELILIDDASVDESSNIISEYARRDKRIRIITNKVNIGVAKCRNLGIDIAKGEFLTILDSDDYFSHDMLQEGICAFRNTNTDISYWEHYDLDDITGNIQPGNKVGKCIMNGITDISHPQNCPDYVFLLFKPPAWHKLYRTSFVRENNLQFQDLPSSNDVFFGRLSCVLARRIAYISKPLVYYRRNRSGQISSNGDSAHGENSVIAMEFLRKHMMDKRIFKNFSRAFYSAVIEEVLYTIRKMANMQEQMNFVDFMESFGWNRLGMENLFPSDFISPLDYKAWFRFRHKSELKNIPKDISDFFGENTIESVQSIGRRFCLWGWGKRGKKFFSIAYKYGLNIVCIVDRNEALSGTEIYGIPIDRLERQKTLFDTVIMTNSSFGEEIKLELNHLGKEDVKVVDIEYAVTYEKPIYSCQV